MAKTLGKKSKGMMATKTLLEDEIELVYDKLDRVEEELCDRIEDLGERVYDLEDVPPPEPAPSQLRVKLLAYAALGSMVMYAADQDKVAMVVAGTALIVGLGVEFVNFLEPQWDSWNEREF